MAHLGHLGTELGTSFASPRACADAAAALADPKRKPSCKVAQSLMIAAYGLKTPLKDWNERVGFHRQKSDCDSG
jgi:hypothetical protein